MYKPCNNNGRRRRSVSSLHASHPRLDGCKVVSGRCTPTRPLERALRLFCVRPPHPYSHPPKATHPPLSVVCVLVFAITSPEICRAGVNLCPCRLRNRLVFNYTETISIMFPVIRTHEQRERADESLRWAMSSSLALCLCACAMTHSIFIDLRSSVGGWIAPIRLHTLEIRL